MLRAVMVFSLLFLKKAIFAIELNVYAILSYTLT